MRKTEYLVEEKMKQYHNIISQFSGYSFSIKKLFVTTISVFIPIILQADVYKNFEKNNDMSKLSNLLTFFIPFLFILIITLLFYIIDCTTYYYQDTMQQNLYKEEIIYKDNSIHMYNLNKELRFSSTTNRILRTLTNISHLIYLIVYLLNFGAASIIAIQIEIENKKIPLCINFILCLVMLSCIFIMNLFEKNTSKEKVFISYTMKNNEVTKEELSYLKKFIFVQYGVLCFIDLLDNKKRGGKVQKEIEKQIRKSDWVIVLTSPSYKNSKWVRYEIDYALKKRKKVRKISYNSLLLGKSISLNESIKKNKPSLINE